MGLDMYLTAKRYISKYKSEDKAIATELAKAIGVTDKQIRCIEVDAMYWRKANAIHGWFVKNVQDGEDDCGTYEVPISKLVDLYDTLISVLRDKNVELLPPTGGFFFGEYDTSEGSYFWEYVKDTKDDLEKLLADKDFCDNFEYYYRASW